MLINLLDSPTISEMISPHFFEVNMAEMFYVLLIQFHFTENTKEKLFKILKLLSRSKKLTDKLKGRIFKLDNIGGYNGLLSKMISSQNFFTTKVYTQVINEKFINNLIDLYFLNHSTQPTTNQSPSQITTNYDALWTILSLLTPSNSINNEADLELLIKLRLKLCNMLVKHVNANPNIVPLLVKPFGWQDILCQLLCFTYKSNTNIHKGNSKLTLITSTPERKRHLFSECKDSTDSQDKFKSIDSDISMNKTNLTSPNMNCTKDEESLLQLNDKAQSENEESNNIEENKVKLCEKVIYLMFKLSWDGIAGSNETTWKVKLIYFNFKLIFNLIKNLFKGTMPNIFEPLPPNKRIQFR